MNHRERVERSVLQILTGQLRVATENQLTRAAMQSWSVSKPAALTVLRGLRRCRLLCSQRLPIALPELSGPLVSWRPGRLAPDFNAVAWSAAKRLADTRPRRQRVYWASPLATRRMGGGGGRLSKPLQVEHDLGVAAIYFARLRVDPTTTARWQGEDAYARLRRPTRGHKKPDAVLLTTSDDNEGRFDLVLDYLSLYPPARLRAFHHYWSARNTRYEWW